MSNFRSPACVRLILAALAMCAAGAADAQWWNRESLVPPNQRAFTPLLYKRGDIGRARERIREALEASDIATIEHMHEDFLALEKAGGNGRWMMQGMEAAVDSVLPQLAEDRARMDTLFATWKKLYPDSKLRPSFEAAAWMARGWAARGHDVASTVSPEAMKIFRDDHEIAMRVLREGAAHGKESPLWYADALSIAGVTGQPPAVLDALFEEGASRFPLDRRLYSTRVNFLLPQWGGSYERVDSFIRSAVLRTQAREGTSIYAALYYDVSRTFQGKNFFTGTKASWKLMRHSFEDGAALDEDSGWTNLYAAFSCMAQDKATLRRLLKQLGEYADFGAVLRGASEEVCSEMTRE